MTTRQILTALAVSTGLGLCASPAEAQVDNSIVIGSWRCAGSSSVGVGTHTTTIRIDGSGRMNYYQSSMDTYSRGDTYQSTTNADGSWYFNGGQVIFRPSSITSCFRGRCEYAPLRIMRFTVTNGDLYDGDEFCNKESGPHTTPGNPYARFIRPMAPVEIPQGNTSSSPNYPPRNYSPNAGGSGAPRHSLRSRMEIMNDIRSVQADITRCETNSDFNAQHNMGTWYNTMCASQVASQRARLATLQAELSAADH